MTATATKTRSKSGIAWNVGELLATLRKLDKVVEKKPLLPVLTNVLFRDGRIIAGNGSLQVSCPLDSGIEILLPFSRLKAILESCRRDDEVTLSEGKSTCKLSCGAASWVLPTGSPDEFPVMAAPGATTFFRVPADQFRRMAAAVTHAVDDTKSATSLRGICFDVLDGDVTFVATDGKAMATAETGIDQAVDDKSRLVPVDAVEIMRTFADGEGGVQLDSSGTAIVFDVDQGATVTATLVNGTFPIWRNALPDASRVGLGVVDKEILTNAIKSAKVCSDEMSRGVTFTFSEAGLKLHSKSATAGEASVSCDLQEFGHAGSVKLDPQYVLDWLDNLPADGDPMICVESSEKLDKVVFRSDDYLTVVAPLA